MSSEKTMGVAKSCGFRSLRARSLLLFRFEIGRMPHLIKTASALMLTQWIRLNWPQPHFLIPFPESFFFQSNDPSYLVAKELSKTLESEVCCALGRLPHQFFLKKREEIEDATLLIVGVCLEMEVFEKMAEMLEEAFPAKIYGLSLC